MAVETVFHFSQNPAENSAIDLEIQTLGKALRADCVMLLSNYGISRGKKGFDKILQRIKNVSLSRVEELKLNSKPAISGDSNTSASFFEIPGDEILRPATPDDPVLIADSVPSLTIITYPGKMDPNNAEFIFVECPEVIDDPKELDDVYLRIGKDGKTDIMNGLVRWGKHIIVEDAWFPKDAQFKKGKLIGFREMVNRVGIIRKSKENLVLAD